MLNDLTSKSDAEKGALENHLQQASQYISDLETRLTTVTADNDRLMRNGEEKSREMEGLRIRLAGLEGNLSMLQSMQNTMTIPQTTEKTKVTTTQIFQTTGSKKF